MGEFYFMLVVLVLYYFLDMRDRKKKRFKVVRRNSATVSVFRPFIAASLRNIVLFKRRKHKFSFFTNNYTLIRRRYSIARSSSFDIPKFRISR